MDNKVSRERLTELTNRCRVFPANNGRGEVIINSEIRPCTDYEAYLMAVELCKRAQITVPTDVIEAACAYGGLTLTKTGNHIRNLGKTPASVMAEQLQQILEDSVS